MIRRWLACMLVPSLCAAALLVGCEDKPAPAPASSATATSTEDLRSICSNVCDRTTECALSIARRATRGYEDKPDVKRAVADEERAARENLDACKKDCREQPIAPSDRKQLSDAAKCLAKTDCDAFIACFEQLGAETK